MEALLLWPLAHQLRRIQTDRSAEGLFGCGMALEDVLLALEGSSEPCSCEDVPCVLGVRAASSTHHFRPLVSLFETID